MPNVTGSGARTPSGRDAGRRRLLRTLPGMPVPTAAAPVWTVVVAGGGGTRFGGPKQYVELAGRRAIDWSLATARTVSDGVVVVVPADDLDDAVPDADAVVAGGDTRSASVRNGLAAVPGDAGVVLVHDAARPAASPALFRAVVDAVRAGAEAVVPGVAVTDSLRHRSGGAVDRDDMVAVQTPQGFDAAVLRSAHASGADASDDASLIEAAGGTVVVVLGETTNVKLTHPSDRVALEATLASRSGEGAPA
jgi:2-C-methyl-D-erythritol 4-phosphate cytidylyltransferase